VKLPAVAIAAAYACGIALGLCPLVESSATSRILLIAGFTVVACTVAAGILLTVFRQLIPAAMSLLSWGLLGVLSAGIAQQPLPPNHIITLIDENRIDLHSPLRSHGRLRDEPARLPWGLSYEIDLTAVETQGSFLPARGGLRLGFTPRPGEHALLDLHAGDEITVLAQARRPQLFRDTGAFDRRGYLATQGVDLTATLRAPQLIERVEAASRSPRNLLAALRRHLRDVIDRLYDGQLEVAGVLRAMLLGDRSFVERDESLDFQKTGVFHVLVVAGLHVGALAVLLFWLSRKLRLSPAWTIAVNLSVLAAYVAVVEQRPPVLRAALMVAAIALGMFFYRRLEQQIKAEF
jgi:competence protein ComEC